MSAQSQTVLLIWLYFGIWAAVHSLTASLALKQWLKKTIGKSYNLYPLFYVIFSIISLGIFYLVLPDVPGLVYAIPPPLSYLMRAVQLISAVLAVAAVRTLDIWEFVGLRQALRFGRRARPAQPVLVTTGFYGFVRHPLYLFAIIFLWANPVVTYRYVAISVGFSLYLWVGSYFEERKLVAQFGRSYTDYQTRVSRILPLKWIAGRILARAQG